MEPMVRIELTTYALRPTATDKGGHFEDTRDHFRAVTLHLSAGPTCSRTPETAPYDRDAVRNAPREANKVDHPDTVLIAKFLDAFRVNDALENIEPRGTTEERDREIARRGDRLAAQLGPVAEYRLRRVAELTQATALVRRYPVLPFPHSSVRTQACASWNAAWVANEWQTLPAICAECEMPVFQPVRLDATTHPSCAATVRQRRSRVAKAKLSAKRPARIMEQIKACHACTALREACPTHAPQLQELLSREDAKARGASDALDRVDRGAGSLDRAERDTSRGRR